MDLGPWRPARSDSFRVRVMRLTNNLRRTVWVSQQKISDVIERDSRRRQCAGRINVHLTPVARKLPLILIDFEC
jgi:hypothetical protein